MKLFINSFLIHLVIFLDNLGNWTFNIFLFDQLKSIEERGIYIAVFFSFIRFSNFFSLFLGGRFFNNPKTFFLWTVILRIITLGTAYYFIDGKEFIFVVSVLLLSLLAKNILGGADGGIYTQLINKYLDAKPIHYKVKDVLMSLSLVASWPLYMILVDYDKNSPILFDILSYLFLLIIVCFATFEFQKMEHKKLLKALDVFRVFFKTPNASALLKYLCFGALGHTLIFNYAYDYTLRLNLFEGIAPLYGLIGASFFLGNILSKIINYQFRLSVMLFIFGLILLVYKFFPHYEWICLSAFVFGNSLYTFNLFKVNSQYFPAIHKADTTVMSNLYSIVFLISSVLGAWVLALCEIDSLGAIYIATLILFSVLSLAEKIFFYYCERKNLKSMAIDLNYFSFEHLGDKYIHLYVEKDKVNANEIIKVNLYFIKSFFDAHSKVYSEIVERVKAVKTFGERGFEPSSNGCAAHITSQLAKEHSMLELLERDSIIVHTALSQPAIFHFEAKEYQKELTGTFYFYPTMKNDYFACVYCAEDAIGYSCIKVTTFTRDEAYSGMSKAYREYLVCLSSNLHALNKTPALNDADIFEYYGKHIAQYSGAALMLEIVQRNKEKLFLNETHNIISFGLYNKDNFLYPLDAVDLKVYTGYCEEFGRFFSYPKSFNHSYPMWPVLDKKLLDQINKRATDRGVEVKELTSICPII